MCGAAFGCGSKSHPTPISPTPTLAAAPQIVCPADLSATIRGGSAAVNFSAPAVTGGNAPVGFACTPASGTAFPVGTTTVSCVATDSAGLSSLSCSFSVRLAGVQLGIKRFDAIGDSLTLGENGVPVQTMFVDEPNAYPTKLGLLLEAQFPGQGIVVVNRGRGGQKFDGPSGTLELMPGYLTADQPEAVLIVGGYNHITTPCHFGTPADEPSCATAVEGAEDALREVIRVAKAWPGVRYVFVSTLTPQGSVEASSPDRRIDPRPLFDLNERIRNSVSLGGAILVDSFAAFTGHEAEYVSVDGLHLRPAGYQAIANLFYSRILETVPQSNPVRLR